jgi:hypothetical protein
MRDGSVFLIQTGYILSNGLGIPADIETLSVELDTGCLLDELFEITFDPCKFVYVCVRVNDLQLCARYKHR